MVTPGRSRSASGVEDGRDRKAPDVAFDINRPLSSSSAVTPPERTAWSGDGGSGPRAHRLTPEPTSARPSPLRDPSPSFLSTSNLSPRDVSPFARDRYRAPRSAISPYWSSHDATTNVDEILRRSSATQTTPAGSATNQATYGPNRVNLATTLGQPIHNNLFPRVPSGLSESQRPYQMNSLHATPTIEGVREQQQIIRNAMRMETESKSKQAAASERENRRRRLVAAHESRARVAARDAVMGD